jgi:hypothetical protein
MSQSMIRTSLVMLRHGRCTRISRTESASRLSNHCVNRDFPARRSSSSSSTTTYNQYRYQSSARPLPDDQHEDHGWSDAEELFYPPKRVSQKEVSKKFSTTMPSTQHDESSTYWEVEFDNMKTSPIESLESSVIQGPNSVAIPPLQYENEPVVENIEMMTAAEVISSTSPSCLTYTGDAIIPITSTLNLVKPKEDAPRGIWPVFRLMVCSCLFNLLNHYSSLILSQIFLLYYLNSQG